MKTRILIGVLCVFCGLIAIGGLAFGQSVPSLINYQGRLTDSVGNPVTGMSVPMSFAVWDGDTGGTSLWSESRLVSVSGGLFTVNLGEGTPIPASVFSTATTYLEVIVNGETLGPRARLTSSPYAMKAQNATHADSADTATTAGSATNSTTAFDLACTDCIGTTEIAFSGFDSDLLDGQHGSYYQNASNINAGTLGNGYFSAYADLNAEGILDNNASGDLPTQGQADARYVNEGQADSITSAMITDGQIGSADISFNYAASSSKGGPADNSNLLNGQAASYYRNASNINAGALNAGYFSAYTDLGTEGYLDNNAVDDLITQSQADGRFVNEGQTDSITAAMAQFNYAGSASEGGPATTALDLTCTDCIGTTEIAFTGFDSDLLDGQHGSYYQNASNINAGTLDNGYFSAYADLTDEGALDNNSPYDLLTREQADSLYGGTAGLPAGDIFITGDLSVLGGNLGIGTTADPNYSIINDPDAAPLYGAMLHGSSIGGAFICEGTGNKTWGVFGSGTNYVYSGYVVGGYFESEGAESYGVDASALGNSDSEAVGVCGEAENYSTGDAYGGWFEAYAEFGTTYAGYFNATDYGVYARGGQYGLYVASGSKNWVNPDPEAPDKSIVYSTLEGGENGTYWAGRARLENGRAEIILPDHFRKVTSPDHPVIVQLTPRSADSQGLAVIESTNEKIVVQELAQGRGNYEFDYFAKGIRLGYEDYQPIIDNVDYVPFQGNLKNMDPSETTTQEYYDRQSPGLKKIYQKNGMLDASGKVNEKLFKEKGWELRKEKAPKKERRSAHKFPRPGK